MGQDRCRAGAASDVPRKGSQHGGRLGVGVEDVGANVNVNEDYDVGENVDGDGDGNVGIDADADAVPVGVHSAPDRLRALDGRNQHEQQSLMDLIACAHGGPRC